MSEIITALVYYVTRAPKAVPRVAGLSRCFSSSALALRRLLLTAAGAAAATAESVRLSAAIVVTLPCRRQRQISSAANNYLSDEP